MVYLPPFPVLLCDFWRSSSSSSSHFARPAADKLVVFESNKGYARATPAAWTRSHDAAQFCALPYQIASWRTMRSYVRLAVKRRVGFIYVTDDGKDGNPWDRLPVYWKREVAAVKAALPK